MEYIVLSDIECALVINKQEFKVYHKPTCKNDHIHFYSHHNNNTKRGIIIGFISELYVFDPQNV